MGSVALEGFGSGGAGLNFKVICNPQPSTTKENTIWVDTDRINNYYFSVEQPENMVDYDVWFSIGTSSPVAFSTTKKNFVMVYPLSAKQMVSGALVGVTAKSYQGGEWVGWVTYLFKDGNPYEEITGGWTSDGYIYYGTSYVKLAPVVGKTITLEASKMSGSSSTACIYGTRNAIDLTDKKMVFVDVLSAVGNCSITLTDSGKNVHPSKCVASKSLSVGTTTLEVPAGGGMYYIAVHASYSSTSTTNRAEVNNIRYE